MPEILVSFADPIASKAGDVYAARACGRPTAAGTWEGWLEFVPVDGSPAIRSGRETTQPNRDDTEVPGNRPDHGVSRGRTGARIDSAHHT